MIKSDNKALNINKLEPGIIVIIFTVFIITSFFTVHSNKLLSLINNIDEQWIIKAVMMTFIVIPMSLAIINIVIISANALLITKILKLNNKYKGFNNMGLLYGITLAFITAFITFSIGNELCYELFGLIITFIILSNNLKTGGI